MKTRRLYRFGQVVCVLFIVVSSAVGCAGKAQDNPTAAPTTPPTAPPTASPTAPPAASSPTAKATDAAVPSTPVPVADKGVLYQDDFTDPASGWPEEKFDNYFIGYHEPEYYHIEITSPNYKTSVFAPNKQSFTDSTIEVKALTVSKKTTPTGDFSYGPAFRRSGDQYYAFTISPRTKKWSVLKSSPTALVVLTEGTEESIHPLDAEDDLRVDAQGSDFSFYINGHPVGQVTDPDYASGETGLFVETFDSTDVHVHFDSLSIRNVESSQPLGPDEVMLYQDEFTDPTTGWPEKKFDNYFIGYHEPEYYHIEITSPNYKTSVYEPGKQSFSDVTIELRVFTNSKKTSSTGDFSYGTVFRRSGDQYYAFTISPRTKKWYMLKSSPTALVVLAEGVDDGIHDLDVEDILRVDAQGSKFFLHINNKVVGQVTDPDYASGEIGLFAQTFDSTNVHVHFDSLGVRNYVAPLACTINALTLNVRSGPGTSYGSPTFLSRDDIVIPVGRSEDGEWIKVRLKGGEDQGWIFNSPGFVTCSSAVDLLEVLKP